MEKLSAYKIYVMFCFFNALVFSMIFTVTMVYQVQIVHLNPLQLVLAGTVFEIICFVFQIPTGVVADLYSRKLAIVFGTVIIGIGFVIQASFSCYIAVIASQIFWGIGTTLTDGSVEAWAADEMQSTNLNMIYMNGAKFSQIGSVIGILLCTIMANYNVALPIFIGGVLLIAIGIILAVYMPEHNFKPIQSEELNTFKKMAFTFSEGIRLISRKSILIMLLFVALFNGLASEGYDRLSDAHFISDTVMPHLWKLRPVTWFGIFGIIAMIISTIVMQYMIKRFKNNTSSDSIRILLVTNSIYMISMFAFGITGNFGIMLAAFIMLNILKSVNKPLMRGIISNNINGSIRATVLSTNNQVNSLGEIAGGIIIGFIANKFSIGIGLCATLVFMLPIIIILRRMKREAFE